MSVKRLIAIAASLACGSVAALDVSPPAPLSCGGNAGETMTGAVVSLLEKNAQRTYRTVPPTATGTVTLAFTKRTSAVTIDGVRLNCAFSSATGARVYQTDFRIPPVAVPVGDTPRTVISIQASPRKITWPVATTPVTPPPPVAAPLPIPGNPTLVTDPGGVKATWAASPGATAYVITWGSNAAGDANTLTVTATSVVVKMAGAGWLCVAARNSAGTSSNQCNSYAPPVTSTGQADLAWGAPASGSPDGYTVYFGTIAGAHDAETAVGGVRVGNVLKYTVTGLSSGRRYYFVVKAIYGDAESGPSNEVFKDF